MTKKTYEVDLICEKVDHPIHWTTEATGFGNAEKLALKEWEVLNPTVTAVRYVENPPADYESQKVPVAMTRGMWSQLTCYLLMTTKYREGERDTWRKLATEKNDDGTIKFTNAESNANFWDKVITDIEEVIKTVDNA